MLLLSLNSSTTGGTSEITSVYPLFQWYSCYSIFRFLCSVLVWQLSFRLFSFVRCIIPQITTYNCGFNIFILLVIAWLCKTVNVNPACCDVYSPSRYVINFQWSVVFTINITDDHDIDELFRKAVVLNTNNSVH
jgi:hypothetical protein